MFHSTKLQNISSFMMVMMFFHLRFLAAEFDNDITEVDWRDILKRRNGGTTTQKLLQILKDLRADIVAEIKFKNEK